MRGFYRGAAKAGSGKLATAQHVSREIPVPEGSKELFHVKQSQFHQVQ
jgi:hypothetical protein